MSESNIDNITTYIRKMNAEMTSPFNDGFMAWGIKQDLYLMKFFIDKILADAPEFVGEDEWLTEQEQKQVMEILKK